MDEIMTSERRRGHRVGWIVAAVLFVLVAAVVWVGVRGLLAVQELRAALPAASRVQSAIESGSAADAASQSSELRRHADAAHSLTSDPVWRAFEAVPGLGRNLSALDGVASSAASIADDGLDSLASLSGSLSASTFKPKGGALDLAPLAHAAPALAKADKAVQRGAQDAARLDGRGLIAPLASAVADYKAKVAGVAEFTDAASRASALLPAMLGQDGRRSYLLLVLNNAELRAPGGIPGSVVHVTADKGRIAFDDQYSARSFGEYDEPIVPLTDSTNQLYGEITGEFMQDVTLTPHFDESAQLASAMWQERFGQDVDGVVSLDPVALKYILQATGPVIVGAGTPLKAQLTPDNVVRVLMSDVYARFSDPAQQDAFFNAASSAIFEKVAAGGFDPKAMLTAFGRIGDERRMNVWSATAAEQESIAQTTLAGGPARSAGGDQRFNVYLSDGTGSKMDYYLHTSVALGQLTCKPVGALYVVEVTLRNGLTAAQAAKLPAYVSGGGSYGVPVGTIRTQVTGYGSAGVEFGNAFDGDGTAEPVKFVKDGGRSAAQYVVDLKPGESQTVRLVYNPKKGEGGRIQADVTPQINPVAVTRGGFDCGTVLK